MSVIVLLIAAGGLVAAGFLAAFIWAVHSGQFDDMWTPALRVLLEERALAPDTRERDEERTDPAGRRQQSPGLGT